MIINICLNAIAVVAAISGIILLIDFVAVVTRITRNIIEEVKEENDDDSR